MAKKHNEHTLPRPLLFYNPEFKGSGYEWTFALSNMDQRSWKKKEMTDKRPETENTETEPRGSKLASSVKKKKNNTAAWAANDSVLHLPDQGLFTKPGSPPIVCPLCVLSLERHLSVCTAACLPARASSTPSHPRTGENSLGTCEKSHARSDVCLNQDHFG